MRDSLAPTEIADLLAHSAWIRTLAGALVRDDARADDLAQETWVAALRHPPAASLPARPWLAQVLRNVLRMGLRGDRRRRTREESARETAELDGAGADTPELLLARAQQQRALADLVIELAEPYRSTILLRFFEGLSAVEIAHREGVPPGTVRWRLKRGLDQLRAELDRCHAGSRQAWQLALAPLGAVSQEGGAGTALSAPAAMPAALKGVPIMKTLLSASVVIAGLAGGALLMSPSARPHHPAAACAPAEPPAPASAQSHAPAQKLDAQQRQHLLQRIIQMRQTRQTQRRPARGDTTATPAPPLDAAYIRAQIQTLLPLLKECYENTLRGHGGVRGKLVVDFTIVGEPDLGALVSESAINDAASTITDADLRECVRETMYAARFPAPTSGGEVHVSYPFAFSPTETP